MKSSWIRKADDAQDAAAGGGTPTMKPLDKVEEDRKPAPVQPTALPEAPEAIPMNDLLKAFEQAANELMTSSLGIHKASVAMKKITTSSGRTPAEMSLISKAEGLISQIEELHTRAQQLADNVASERTKLLGHEEPAAKAGWTSK